MGSTFDGFARHTSTGCPICCSRTDRCPVEANQLHNAPVSRKHRSPTHPDDKRQSSERPFIVETSSSSDSRKGYKVSEYDGYESNNNENP